MGEFFLLLFLDVAAAGNWLTLTPRGLVAPLRLRVLGGPSPYIDPPILTRSNCIKPYLIYDSPDDLLPILTCRSPLSLTSREGPQ